MSVSLRAVALLFVAGALAATVGSADTRRHLRLERAEPAADTVVSAAPDELRLFYSEQPGINTTTVRLLTEDETPIELESPVLDEENVKLVRVGITGAVAPGMYTVAWRTTSADGHVVRGDYRFTVRAADAPSAEAPR